MMSRSSNDTRTEGVDKDIEKDAFPTDSPPQTPSQSSTQHSATRYPPAPDSHDTYYVEFEEGDPANPMNWSLSKKLYISAIGCYTCVCSTFASTVFSPATEVLGQAFGVSGEVGILATSLFVLGYCFGPSIWGPSSEVYGRRYPIIIAVFGWLCFSAGAATGKDIQTVMLCRFFAGVMASCPLIVIAGLFTDIYDNLHRGMAIAIFAGCIFAGPALAPFIGGFTIMNPALGWRFNGYWSLIMVAIALTLIVFFLPETYPGVVLAKKASQLRRETGNWAIRAKHEELDVTVPQLVTKYFTRPLKMFITEPILMLVTLYMSFLYGLIYLFFEAYPIVFGRIHHFNPGESGLPFFALLIGVIGACVLNVSQVPVMHRKMQANGGKIVPEWRLPQVVLGGICFAIGLFWFGWTGFTARIHWIVPTLSGLMTGFGFVSIFMPLFNYIIDTYLMYAASAIAANTIIRSAWGAGFPLFANYMYAGLGVGLATTVLGCVAVACIPIPLMFYFYGKKLREMSRFAPTM